MIDIASVDRGGLPFRPLVTIIVINHDYEEFVAAAIKSALSQDYDRIEILVVDDGSTDKSRIIIESFGDRVRREFKQRGGHVSAFNHGFATSQGDLVLFLDADDLIYPHYVSTVVQAWEPSLAKVQCRLDTIDREGVDQNMPFPYFAPDLTPAAVLHQAVTHGIYPWSVSTGNIYARSFLARLLPLITTESASPDGYVNKLAPLYGDVKSLDLVLGAYRVHGKNRWAQTARAVKLTGLARAVRLDLWNHEHFEAHARTTGYEVPRYHDLEVPHIWENRLLSLRLAPAQHPFPGDSRLALTRQGFRSARNAPNLSHIGRIAWAIWFCVLGSAPKRIITQLFEMGRAQTRRSHVARILVRFSRGLSVVRGASRLPSKVQPGR